LKDFFPLADPSTLISEEQRKEAAKIRSVFSLSRGIKIKLLARESEEFDSFHSFTIDATISSPAARTRTSDKGLLVI
jgi:hypothetical protein